MPHGYKQLEEMEAHLLSCTWPLWAETQLSPGTEATFPSPGPRDVSER